MDGFTTRVIRAPAQVPQVTSTGAAEPGPTHRAG